MTAPPLEFPAGSMLTVLRASAGRDKFGDPIGDGYQPSHDIGPCKIVRTQASRETDKQDRIVDRISVRCAQVDADVRQSDRVRLPNGRVCAVASRPHTPTNGFTGWRPSLRFTLEEVG
ncbi:Uncharacterised protein [Mycobacteroides abscessus subsp. abscessus]|nr:Uncharacterised protein [Mycobacteroides abscessus subsp. abscessus]